MNELGKKEDITRQLQLDDSTTMQEIQECLVEKAVNKWRNRKGKPKKRSKFGDWMADEEKTPQGKTLKPNCWQRLLGDDDEDLQDYNNSGDHISYLQGKQVEDKGVGCFLVGAKEDSVKPVPLGAVLLAEPLEGKTVDCTINVMVVAVPPTSSGGKVVYMPEPTGAFEVPTGRLSAFDQISWPVIGLLAIKKGRNAVAWSKAKWGLTEQSLQAAISYMMTHQKERLLAVAAQ
ncbi:hypothetical protein Vretifemale_3422 [Volvox reticuliferus]|nr:hypothetical protein Vretifemale_3422 [Volvox reticuliferus]